MGTDNKKQLRWMVVLMATAATLGIYRFGGLIEAGSSAPSDSNAASAASSISRGTQVETRVQVDSLLPLDSNAARLGARNIFRMQDINGDFNENIAPPAKDTGNGPRPLPQPLPEIPLKFYGFADRSSEARRIFLQHDDQEFVAKVGDVVERHYKVIEISQNSVTIEDVLRNYSQEIPLTGR